MIVNTNTGEVINPRRLRSNNTYRGYYSVNYKHSHSYKPSVFGIIGMVRNFGGRVRRNSFSILVIFVILLYYMSIVAKLTGKGTVFTFTGLLRYFTLIGKSVEYFPLVTYFQSFQEGGTKFVELANFRFEGLLEILNPFLAVLSPTFLVLGYAGSLFGFIGECFTLLLGFALSTANYLFTGLFM